MIVTDPIADMLTRMRNANQMRYKEVEIPSSKIKLEIANILRDEGFIEGYKVEERETNQWILVSLKYGPKKERVISGLKRISKPGLRVYAGVEEIPTVLNGFGIAILSTSKGLMSNKQAKKNQVGGEVLAYIW